MPAIVTADLFSGVPNPQWEIAGDLLVQLQLLLAQLSPWAGVVPEPPGLGYRGLLVELGNHGGAPLRVFGGYVVGDNAAWSDPGRALERFLLESGVRATGAEALRDLLSGLR